MFKRLVRALLGRLYRVEIRGREHLGAIDERVMVVANHTSLLDVVLLWAYLPVPLTFAVNTEIAKRWYVRLVRGLAECFPLDPINPLSLRSLVRRLREGAVVVIFPEGRITVTGALMKIYHGPGLVAVRAEARVLPIAIEGAQYTPFSRLKGKVRLRLFPRVRLTIFPPRAIEVAEEVRGRRRRELAGKQLSDLMTETVFQAAPRHSTLFQRLLDARKIHGGGQVVVEDVERRPLGYDALLTRALLLGDLLAQRSRRGEAVGVMLPNTTAAVVTFWGLQAHGRVAAMLNYTAGPAGLVSAVKVARISTVVTSRRFVEKAGLEAAVEALSEVAGIVWLEELAGSISRGHKLRAALTARCDGAIRRHVGGTFGEPDDAAVILFTSGTEGMPKGVVLSHANLLANLHQVSARFDFTARDVVLATLPMFHAFGMTGCCLLPLLSGMRAFFYPTPLHYRVIPEIAYEINATVLFGTNTFLAGYGRAAHPYDFYSVRYVFAGAERLQEEVRRLWQEKFGIRLFEGYGATECSPVISGNDPMNHRPGTVGRLIPGMECRLEAVEGLEQGARLHVRGPNVMKGYLLADRPGELVPPASSFGPGWYDTGDIVTLDEEGFITIADRARRFAKVAGEMVPLASVEKLARECWPEGEHVAVALPDSRKGERIVLLTTWPRADRADLSAFARQHGAPELQVPRQVIGIDAIPLLGSGKIDHRAARELAEGGNRSRTLG